MGSTWVLSASDGPRGSPMNLAYRVFTAIIMDRKDVRNTTRGPRWQLSKFMYKILFTIVIASAQIWKIIKYMI